MLETLDSRRKYIGVILLDEHALTNLFPKILILKLFGNLWGN